MNKKQHHKNNGAELRRKILFGSLFCLLGAGIMTASIATPLILISLKKDKHTKPKFSIEPEITMLDPVYTTINLHWTPINDTIMFSNFNFIFIYSGEYFTTDVISVTESTKGCASLAVEFNINKPVVDDDIKGGILEFDFFDKTASIHDHQVIHNINISKFNPPLKYDLVYKAVSNYKVTITDYNPTSESNPNLIVPSFIYDKDAGIWKNVIGIETKAFKETGIKTLKILCKLEALGTEIFSNNYPLTDVWFSHNSTPQSITSFCFAYCYRLKSITIPNSVVNIESMAFYDSTGLPTINIPKKVKNIGSQAFAFCTNLTSINFDGTITQFKSITKGDQWHASVGVNFVSCIDGLCPIDPEVITFGIGCTQHAYIEKRRIDD